VQRLTALILATQEVEIGRIIVQDQPRQKNLGNSVLTNIKKLGAGMNAWLPKEKCELPFEK
jgi:predicted GNAT family N-acyltransferase